MRASALGSSRFERGVRFDAPHQILFELQGRGASCCAAPIAEWLITGSFEPASLYLLRSKDCFAIPREASLPAKLPYGPPVAAKDGSALEQLVNRLGARLPRLCFTHRGRRNFHPWSHQRPFQRWPKGSYFPLLQGSLSRRIRLVCVEYSGSRRRYPGAGKASKSRSCWGSASCGLEQD